MRIAVEVAEALAAGRPVVALESTIITHGLPRPRNLEIARQVEAEVRAGGALPATIAMVAGEARVGLDDDALAAVAERDDVLKCGVRDLAPLAARGGWGGTTVAATAHLAARAGIRVFATGGLGGVHRGARESWDESADLTTLASTGIVVVCAGVKSILDVGATLERLETLNVTVLGYGTRQLPRLLPLGLGTSGGLAGRFPGRGGGRGERADGARHRRARRGGGEPTATGRAARSRAPRPRAGGGVRGRRERRGLRQGRDPLPARLPRARDRWRRASRRTCGS